MGSELNITDHYVELLEKVIEENKLLRDTVKQQADSHTAALNDITSTINDLAGETRNSGRPPKRQREKVSAPLPCRKAFRGMYKTLLEDEEFSGFNMNQSYGGKANQDVVEKVTKAVDADNGGAEKCSWSHAQLKVAGAGYHKSKRDAHTRSTKNAVEAHKTLCRRQGRRREKLQRRKETLITVECSQEKKETYGKVMTIEYTSSDESDYSEDESGNGQKRLKGYIVKDIPWERSVLKKVKKQLDERYLKGLSIRSRSSRLPRVRCGISDKAHPQDVHGWAVRSLSISDVTASTPRGKSLSKTL